MIKRPYTQFAFVFLALLALALLAALLCGFTCAPPQYELDPNHDYMEDMIAACAAGYTAAGERAAWARNMKIDAFHLPYDKLDFEDLYLLSKIIYAEAGSYWLSDEWKMCVGEVVLNRVASPEFPDTIREVLEQPGQYYGKNSAYFNSLIPSERCVRLAVRILEGERVLNDATVVFQANFKQGSGTHTMLYDRDLGYTYFCFTNYPYLYES